MKAFSSYVFAALCGFSHANATPQDTPATNSSLLSVTKIWDAGKHNAFTDLIRFDGRWFCTFREADAHVGGDGRIRVLVSNSGERWESAALIAEEGVDLRDPKLSIAPGNRLMLTLGGSVYNGRTLVERQPRVAFSTNGRSWSKQVRVLEKDDWLWRVTWHKGRAYGITYTVPVQGPPGAEWSVSVVASEDGTNYQKVSRLNVPGRPNEGTLRFLDDGRCVALLRREGRDAKSDKQAWIGVSSAPYRDWQWHPAGLFIGGPNFIVLPDGTMVAGGRDVSGRSGPRTFVGPMTLHSVEPKWLLPSGGDCSYPGLVLHEDLLWVSYYSSHEGKSSIYLAKIRIAGSARN
jgi:hypothetical protein